MRDAPSYFLKSAHDNNHNDAMSKYPMNENVLNQSSSRNRNGGYCGIGKN